MNLWDFNTRDSLRLRTNDNKFPVCHERRLPSSYTELTWYGRAEPMICHSSHTATAKR